MPNCESEEPKTGLKVNLIFEKLPFNLLVNLT